MAYNFDCRQFTGYKPCKYKRACEACPHYDPVTQRIAIVSLEAMGAVLRSTCLLPPIRKKYPGAHITWITLKNAKPLLDNNPLIDRLIVVEPKTLPLLQTLEFDELYAVDKSNEAGALSSQITAKKKYGFACDGNGVIRPFTEHGNYQFDVGLNDDLKFFINQKPETQQITETMNLTWERDPYILELSEDEKSTVKARRTEILGSTGAKKIIGYNTGCSVLFPYKKFTVSRAIELVAGWRKEFPDYAVALLGGPEDTERQESIKAAFADDSAVINTPTREGLRSGMMWVDTADMVFSGCSLGLHIAIGLGKPCIAWFGVSCSQEIDLYGKGVHLKADVPCTPCWKKRCDREIKCYDQVSVERVIRATSEIKSQFLD
ncbi:glycosyltransferase family 9 protein [Pseudobacteriovorax antillogorgiicola]|uniref:Heptosyltransferase-2 n=1 Tax=Pseudobacteriovorax antillogorgiicola TaxID=1513793 RepID=A0A1Y6B8N1_9BACT|nr:glycosyltransferase family 9 protein [Pseudobacteriovorax antillogorgiicola]TCS59241.1 heptosyltransferase-2 [Pseudobacteriovorax antillogorgiicola]SME90245.1 heptosyltransferase-2 [Pseudobacteriovorax antillogorgiicola]